MGRSIAGWLGVGTFVVCGLALLGCGPAWSQDSITAPTARAAPPPPAPPPPGTSVLQRDVPLVPVMRRPPRYPGFAYLEGHSGRVMVVLTVGASGAVWGATVETSSGYRELDDAALQAVRGWRFNALDPALPAFMRRARAPVNFSWRALAPGAMAWLPLPQGAQDKHPRPRLEWPGTYLHPRYVAAEQRIPYRDPADAVTALSKSAAPAYRLDGLLSEFVDEAADGRVTDIWFVLDPGMPDSMVVRYEFAGTPAAPVVRVAAVCQPPAATCPRRMPQLLQGPYFARTAGAPIAPSP